MSIRLLTLFFVLAFAGVACVPLPVVTPPMKVKMGGGVGVGDLTDEPDAKSDASTAGLISFSLGVHPAQYFEALEGVDVGAGFIFEAFGDEDLGEEPLVGGYLEGGVVIWSNGTTEKGGQGRLLAIARGDLLSDSAEDGGTGVGFAMGLSLEFIQWEDNLVASTQVEVKDDDTDVSSFVGFAYGESGIGLELTGNHRRVGGQQYNAVMLHVNFRAPTLLGVLLVPIYD